MIYYKYIIRCPILYLSRRVVRRVKYDHPRLICDCTGEQMKICNIEVEFKSSKDIMFMSNKSMMTSYVTADFKKIKRLFTFLISQYLMPKDQLE